MDQRLKIGVIGVGYLGEFHAKKYSAMKDINLVGLVDIDYDRAKEMARKYNTKAYDNYADILSLVDGLSLAVLTESHFEIGYDILDRGIHLLIEKPIALTLEDADQLIDELAESLSCSSISMLSSEGPKQMSPSERELAEELGIIPDAYNS